MPGPNEHTHIVVAFDLCSSSQIMEDRLLSAKFDRYETFLTCFACRKIDFTIDDTGQDVPWPTRETSGWTCAR